MLEIIKRNKWAIIINLVVMFALDITGACFQFIQGGKDGEWIGGNILMFSFIWTLIFMIGIYYSSGPRILGIGEKRDRATMLNYNKKRELGLKNSIPFLIILILNGGITALTAFI